jgi:hypothetical protein
LQPLHDSDLQESQLLFELTLELSQVYELQELLQPPEHEEEPQDSQLLQELFDSESLLHESSEHEETDIP